MRLLSLISAGLVAAAAGPAARAADLPITRVNLFSSGVGYFQRDGAVEGEATIELQFSVNQINDILKSMVLQDFDGGQISAVNFPSQEPIEKALSAFALKIGDNPPLAELLNRCRGSRVQIAGATSLTGTIVGVEARQVFRDDKFITEHYLNLFTDEGLRQLEIGELRHVKLLDPRLNSELAAALGVLSRNLDAEKKTVAVVFRGTDQRRVRIGYLLETPIWQTSYRMVLSSEGAPYIQGWANVVNTTDDDWKDVRLSLVAGRPISFVQDLYTPLYVPRPVVRPELYMSLRPPTYAEGMPSAAPAPAEVMSKLRSLGYVAEQAPAKRGRGAGGRMAEMDAAGIAGGDEAYFQLGLEDSGVASVAAAGEAGELYRYDIEGPVTLERQKAAMLPIVGEKVEAEKFSIYNPAVHAKYPLNGVMLTNSTGLHLMQGPITVFEDNTYAGDARLPDLKPGEKRLLSYALDLGVAVEVEQRPEPVRTTSAKISRGTLIVVQKTLDHRLYKLSNKLERARNVLIEQAMGDDWKLIEPGEPMEKAEQTYRFKVAVEAKKAASYPVRFERTDSVRTVLSTMNTNDMQIYVRNSEVSQKVRDALARVIELRGQLDRLRRAQSDRERQINEIGSEQGRIRENMKSLPRDSDLYNRYVAKLNEQETQIEGLRREVADLKAQADAKEDELTQYIASLEIE